MSVLIKKKKSAIWERKAHVCVALQGFMAVYGLEQINVICTAAANPCEVLHSGHGGGVCAQLNGHRRVTVLFEMSVYVDVVYHCALVTFLLG